MTYTFKNIPEYLWKNLSINHVLKDNRTYYQNEITKKYTIDPIVSFKNQTKDFENNIPILWTSNTHSFSGPISFNDSKKIVNSASKTNNTRKKYAEVPTPLWVCNRQNNLIDSQFDSNIFFNFEYLTKDGEHSWTPTEKVIFNKENDWLKYIISRRMEITCGEVPYIVSPYDTYTNKPIPLLDAKKRFLRVGILDRKLRVISENASKDEWVDLALIALKNVYGYEIQGSNLLIARLNILNTFLEYFDNFYNGDKEIPKTLLIEVCKIISWNFFQMDGLKNVVPGTCSSTCNGCKKKTNTHDGIHPLINFWNTDTESVMVFDNFQKSFKN